MIFPLPIVLDGNRNNSDQHHCNIARWQLCHEVHKNLFPLDYHQIAEDRMQFFFHCKYHFVVLWWKTTIRKLISFCSDYLRYFNIVFVILFHSRATIYINQHKCSRRKETDRHQAEKKGDVGEYVGHIEFAFLRGLNGLKDFQVTHLTFLYSHTLISAVLLTEHQHLRYSNRFQICLPEQLFIEVSSKTVWINSTCLLQRARYGIVPGAVSVG